MFDEFIKRHPPVILTDVLLLEILKELQSNKIVNKEIKKIKPCKHCGETHENKGFAMACARKYKKEGVLNGTAD